MSSQREGEAPAGVRRPRLPRAGAWSRSRSWRSRFPSSSRWSRRPVRRRPRPRAATTVAPVTTVPPATSTGYPTPSSTGWNRTGVTLKPYSGPTIITTNGTVIDGADIRGGVTIKADDVTITRSRITGGGGATYVVLQSSGSSDLRIKDTEVANRAGRGRGSRDQLQGHGHDLDPRLRPRHATWHRNRPAHDSPGLLRRRLQQRLGQPRHGRDVAGRHRPRRAAPQRVRLRNRRMLVGDVRLSRAGSGDPTTTGPSTATSSTGAATASTWATPPPTASHRTRTCG